MSAIYAERRRNGTIKRYYHAYGEKELEERGGSAEKFACACKAEAVAVCDYVEPDILRAKGVFEQNVCGKPLCREHAMSMGADLHVCPPHEKKVKARKESAPAIAL